MKLVTETHARWSLSDGSRCCCLSVCFQPSSEEAKDLDDRVIKDKLRKILKRLGKLKCSKEVNHFHLAKEIHLNTMGEDDVKCFFIFRAVPLPSPASWATCTT